MPLRTLIFENYLKRLQTTTATIQVAVFWAVTPRAVSEDLAAFIIEVKPSNLVPPTTRLHFRYDAVITVLQ
jgi:hypothetical protein